MQVLKSQHFSSPNLPSLYKYSPQARKPAAPGSENSTPAPANPLPASSTSGGQEGQDMSKFNLGSLVQRLNELKGTT